MPAWFSIYEVTSSTPATAGDMVARDLPLDEMVGLVLLATTAYQSSGPKRLCSYALSCNQSCSIRGTLDSKSTLNTRCYRSTPLTAGNV